MYQFTETTIINDALDYTTQLPRWDYANDTFRIKRVGADGNPPLEGQDMQMFHPYPQSVQRKSL